MMRNRLLALLLIASLVALSGCSAAKKTSEPKRDMGAPSKSESMAPATPQPPVAMGAPAPDQARVATMPAGSPPSDMYFQNYGSNQPVSTSRQPVSTFSIDVDTASYTVARNYLNRDTLPPADAIRAEEFINYFPQHYPASTRPVNIHVEGGVSPFRPALNVVKIGLKGKEVSRQERKHAVLTFVIDVSGSMNQENRLGLVKQSLGLLLDQLQSDDQVGIVVYGTNGRILLQHTADKAKIREAINRLKPEGSTNAGEGLQLGYDLANRAFQKGATNRIILCSDGVANTGITQPQAILDSVAENRKQGITLTTVGFGMGNFNDVLMEQLADKGNGQYAYVDSLNEARRIFVEQLSGTLEVVAKDVKVQVQFDPAQVLSYRLVGYENRVMANEDFRNNAADAGEMGAGHTVTALYEVLLQGSGSNLGKVTVRYIDPAHGEAVEVEETIRRSAVTGQASAGLTWTAAVAEFAGVLKGSPWAAETRLASVREVAGGAAYRLDSPEPHKEALALMDRAVRLSGGR